MRWPTTVRLRLRSLFRSSRVEQELDEELQYHLDRLIDENVRLGMRPRQARYAALREMGAIEQRKEDCRDARGLALVDTIRQDLSYALRTFRRSPAFTGVAILSLALGIGASTAIFSLWNGLLHAPLPGVRAPEQLVMLSNPDDTGMWTGRWDGREGPRSWLTWQEFEQLRDEAGAFSALMASQSSFIEWEAFIDRGAPERVRGRLVSGGYFDVLGVTPAIGRLFTADLDRVDSPDAVISYAYWQRRFGGRVDVLGSRITIRSTPLTIIGVAGRGFIGETPAQLPDVWLPARLQPRIIPGRNWLREMPPDKRMWLQVFGRLKPGVTDAHAEAEANALFQRGLDSFYGSYASGDQRDEFLNQRLRLQSGARGASSVRPRLALSLTALLVAVIVLLLIACANLANLLLARGASRKAEIAIRLSLGASRGRILRQLMTESLTLATLGGAAAIPVARMLHTGLVAMQAASDDRFSMQFALDPIVMVFAVSVTFAAALLFGVLPAMQVTRADASAAMKEQTRGAAGSSAQMRASRLLVGLQIALSLPLLVGAGLLGQTVYNLQRVDLGYPAERLLLLRVDLREAAPDRAQHESLLHELLRQLHLVPGVRSVSYSQLGLFTGGESALSIDVEGFTPNDDRDDGSAVDVVGPGYFSTVGVPVYAGREINQSDFDENRQVCVVNEAFAKRFLDGRNPLGLHVTAREETEGHKTWQIVGVARNARSRSLRGDIEPRFFVEGREPASTSTTPTFLIRTHVDSTSVTANARNTIRRINPALAIMSARSIEEQIAPQVAQDRTTAQLAVVLGGVALTLAAIGLYGVLSYGVARRTSEIAIRIALGARAERVVSMILRETVGMVAVGLIAGGGLAYLASRLIGNSLYGVAPQDPLTLGLATLLLLAVALLAAYVPALRASRVDPAAVLRR